MCPCRVSSWFKAKLHKLPIASLLVPIARSRKQRLDCSNLGWFRLGAIAMRWTSVLARSLARLPDLKATGK